MIKRKLIIGIGQLGCEVADVYARTRGSGDASHVMAIDTDERTIETVTAAMPVSMAFPCRICDVLDLFDTELIKPWFPCDRENECVEYFEMMALNEGANQWRMKAMLSFYYFLSNTRYSRDFFAKLERIVSETAETESRQLELYVSASLAGGTGSGLFLPITLYLKRYFAKHGITVSSATALLALPDICEDRLTQEQRIKAHANTYAALRELNAVNLAADGDDSVTFSIGHPDDKLFGLLYDSKSPEFRDPENRPINEVYLFRRIPGFRNISLHARFIADAITSLSNEDTPTIPKSSDAVYGGISIAKTIYPADGIVNYISHAALLHSVNTEWMPLYREASAELMRLKRAGNPQSKNVRSDAEAITEAVMYATEKLCPEDTDSSAALLCRRYPDVDNNPSPEIRLPESYLEKLTESVYREFATDGSARLDSVIAEHREAVRSVSTDKKKADAFFRSKIDRNVLVDLMIECCNDVASYFKNGLSAVENTDKITKVLCDEGSALSVTENVIKDGGRVLHPAYSLVRLCALYQRIDRSLERHRREKLSTVNKEDPGALPGWVVEVDKEVSANCKYGRADSARLGNLFVGDASHVGNKFLDKNLFMYDLESSYNRVRAFFTAQRLETALLILGKWITAYYGFFVAASEAASDLADKTDIALGSFTVNDGMTYFVGASEAEKKLAFNKYVKSLEDEDVSPFEESFDVALGTLALETVCGEPEEMPKGIAGLMSELVCEIKHHIEGKGFYAEQLDRNVLRVLLEQSEKTGGVKSELALCKAFCAGQSPLRYVLPDIHDSYKISRVIKNSVLVNLPEAARDHLATHSADFGGDTPVRIMEKILFDAGEYYGEVVFEDSLPGNELRVIRKTTGLRLSLIEVLNESSKDGVYYKAYKKALAMQEEQTTALWNPHAVCGLADESLPLICTDIDPLL